MKIATEERKKRQRGLLRGGGLARGKGRIQLSVRRAAIGRKVFTTADAAEFAFARKRLLLGRKLVSHDYDLVRRALKLIATPIGRSPRGRGRPTRWRMRDE
jgi:hypothetical protein